MLQAHCFLGNHSRDVVDQLGRADYSVTIPVGLAFQALQQTVGKDTMPSTPANVFIAALIRPRCEQPENSGAGLADVAGIANLVRISAGREPLLQSPRPPSYL